MRDVPHRLLQPGMHPNRHHPTPRAAVSKINGLYLNPTTVQRQITDARLSRLQVVAKCPSLQAVRSVARAVIRRLQGHFLEFVDSIADALVLLRPEADHSSTRGA